jgi:hypothetical protein
MRPTTLVRGGLWVKIQTASAGDHRVVADREERDFQRCGRKATRAPSELKIVVSAAKNEHTHFDIDSHFQIGFHCIEKVKQDMGRKLWLMPP